MLIEDVTIDAEVEKRDRNWLMRFYSELERQGDVGIECHREVVLVKDGKKWDTGGANGERQYTINLLLSQIAMETVQVPDGKGGLITLAAWQLAYGLEKLSDAHAEIPESSSSSASG